MKLTVSQAIIKFLDSQYLEIDRKEYKFVEGVFTIFGHGNVLGIGEALINLDHKLKIITGKNEQGMAHSAIGFTKQWKKRKIFAVTTSIGPGCTNLATAACLATANNLPLLLLPGDIFIDRQSDPVLQQIEQSYDPNIVASNSLKPGCKFWDRISHPNQIKTTLINAFRVLTDTRNTGAVTICLPQDIQTQIIEIEDNFFKKRIWHINRNLSDYQIIQKAKDLIINSKRPMIIAGGGSVYSDGSEIIQKFAFRFNIPIGLTQSGKGLIDWSFRFNLGGIGVTGTNCSNKIAENADLIIGLGTKYSDFTTNSKTLFNKKTKFLNINTKDEDGLKLDGFFVHGDVKVNLEAIFKGLEKEDYLSSWSLKEIDQVRLDWENEINKILQIDQVLIKDVNEKEIVSQFKKNFKNYLRQVNALKIIEKHIPSNGIIVGAAGSLPGDLQRIWNVKEKDTYHVEYGYSCMGYEICASFGAKLACPNQEVFSIVGDGSFCMLHSELLTSLQEKTKIIICLFDNCGYGCIDNLQASKAIKGSINMFRQKKGNEKLFAGDFLDVKYSLIAKGYGCDSYYVTNKDDLISSLKKAIDSKKTTLIHIRVLPKTMTSGYRSWWRTDTNKLSKDKEVEKISLEDQKFLSKKKIN